MNGAIRTLAVGLLATALSMAGPVVALADPGPIDEQVVVSDPSSTTISATVATTGTTANITVPESTVTIGSVSGGSSPDLSNTTTGEGTATVDRTASTSGAGLEPSQTTATTSLTNSASPATVLATDRELFSQGASAGASTSEPVTGTDVDAAVQASALICLLAEASIDPTRVALSSLCGDAPSSADGAAHLNGANALTGVAVGSSVTLRAAICLLGLVASPLPDRIDTADLADVSLSTLCGSKPSTIDATNDMLLAEARTGTQVSTQPIVAMAACLLANGTVGQPSTIELASVCGDRMPSTADGAAPIVLSDAFTGSSAELGPAASAAVCVLLDALARVPASSTESAVVVELTTACGAPDATTPSTADGGAPVTLTTDGGTTADVAPAVDAAICILASAEVALAGSSLAIAEACGESAAEGPEAAVAGFTNAPSDGDRSVRSGASPVAAPDSGEAATSAASTDEATVTPSSLTELAGLPSTSTAATAGIGLILAGTMALAALARRRRG